MCILPECHHIRMITYIAIRVIITTHLICFTTMWWICHDKLCSTKLIAINNCSSDCCGWGSHSCGIKKVRYALITDPFVKLCMQNERNSLFSMHCLHFTIDVYSVCVVFFLYLNAFCFLIFTHPHPQKI